MKNLLKDSKAYYENNDYYEIFSQAEDYESKVAEYLNSISKNKVVLDAGCGTGKFLKVLENNAKEYIGIDLSNDQLSKAKIKSTNKRSKFICSNLSKIPLDDGSIDLIISSWVLGTITDIEERNNVVCELKRILKSNGIIILVENSENSEFEIIRGRDKDTRTKEYNDWILENDFILDCKFNTYFKFKSLEEAKKCFEVIYGSKIASKIASDKIEHKIDIYKFNQIKSKNPKETS